MLLQQPTTFLQQHEALPHFALKFLNKASQKMVFWITPCSLIAYSYQYVVETLIFDQLLYEIQL